MRKRLDTRSLALTTFLGPSVVLIVVFYAFPVVLTFVIALTKMGRTLQLDFIGFDNFLRLFALGDPFVPRVIKNTVVYVAGALPVTVLGGLAIAILSMRVRPAAGLFFRVVFFAPRALPPVVWGFLWAWSFEGTRYGLLNGIGDLLGLKVVHWFTLYPMTIVILANAFLGISLATLVFSSAVASIPRELTRSAEVDGASDWQIVRYIIVPALKWPILTMTAWHLMSFVNSYVYILLITGGGPYRATEVWSLYAYNTAFEQAQFGYGAAMTAVLVAVNVALLLLVLRAFGMRRMLTRGRIEA